MAAFVVILNETVMGVAIPHLMGDLGITATAAQWLTTGFLLTMAVVIPVTGFLLQRVRSRVLYLTAMSLFTAGTALAVVAPGFEVLLVARVIQASGTAIMMPLLITTVMTLVPPAVRGRTMGNISVVIAVAPAIGPTISGLVLEHLSWRFLFVVVLPVAVAVLVLGARRMRDVTEPRATRLDVLSVVLSAVGFGGLVYGLSHLGEVGGSGVAVSAASIAVGVVVTGLFVLRQLQLQRRGDDPARPGVLLDLRTFRTPVFAVSVVMFVVSMMALFGTIILLPLLMQTVLGLSVLTSGLLLLPGGLVMGLAAPHVGRAYDRVGPRPLLVPGTALVAAVLWTMTVVVSTTTPWWLLLALHVALSAGLALVFTAAVHRQPGVAATAPVLPRLGRGEHRAAGGGRSGHRAVRGDDDGRGRLRGGRRRRAGGRDGRRDRHRAAHRGGGRVARRRDGVLRPRERAARRRAGRRGALSTTARRTRPGPGRVLLATRS
ncbi:DHA2 family efflux MFS transporter permease subunit [Quadrisphaera sp. INWT6]|uniref:DHA2 family efflux MFS transporter permease subunit n=1 Tax=Quadrisphaera sp. INWT6 TaxID=2596917 RepID=UPI0019D67FCA|nr:DHA2 family efflux MFS transporter permease subunit [Quadrisphaera sp. INWT6]